MYRTYDPDEFIEDEISNKLLTLSKEVADLRKKSAEQQSPVEETRPEYIDEDFAKTINLPRLWRYQEEYERNYFSADYIPMPDLVEEGVAVEETDPVLKFYPSVTYVLRKVNGEPKFWIQKRGELGNAGFKEWLGNKSKYGTLEHTCLADFLRNNRVYDLDKVPGVIASYIKKYHLKVDVEDWEDDLKMDIGAFAKFVHERDVKPLAVELVCKYEGPEGYFAGAIDLICEMTWSSKRIVALVDFKSGRHGFYEENEQQLGMYKMMAEQSLGIKIDKIFNWAPKDFQEIPTYNLKDQSKADSIARIPIILQMFFSTYEGLKPKLRMNGVLDGSGDLTKNFRKQTPEEIALSYLKRKEINFKKQFSRN